MMKKIAVLVGAGALLLAVAAPALAYPVFFGSKDVAIVTNNVSATASTGGNSQENSGWVVSGNNNLKTGGANAYAGAVTVANTHIGCGPYCGGGGHTDFANVGNYVAANANTGLNDQGNSGLFVEGNNITTTGAAYSTAHAWTIVNTHWGM
jgi:hypothetical protein